MQPTTADFKQAAQLTIAQLKEDLKSIRTGRANPALLEDIMVEAYGSKMKIKEIATLTTEGPGTIVVMPFDPSISTDIEKAILKSPLGITPQPQGNRMLIHIPPMSQEQREKMMKVISQKIEEKRVVIRNHRDDARRRVKQLTESKEISEDQRFRFEKEIDTLNQQYMTEIEGVKTAKEAEIMSV